MQTDVIAVHHQHYGHLTEHSHYLFQIGDFNWTDTSCDRLTGECYPPRTDQGRRVATVSTVACHRLRVLSAYHFPAVTFQTEA